MVDNRSQSVPDVGSDRGPVPGAAGPIGRAVRSDALGPNDDYCFYCRRVFDIRDLDQSGGMCDECRMDGYGRSDQSAAIDRALAKG